MSFSYKQAFDTYIWVKDARNEHENELFQRAEKYAQILSWIPGVRMISVVNSLSMNATDQDSDIDFFLIVQPGNIWFVRFFATLILWICWVWRHGEDIAGNICLSFFITTEAMNLECIAIKDDIYLAFWIEYMIPLYNKEQTYEAFLEANTWRHTFTGEHGTWGVNIDNSHPSKFMKIWDNIIQTFTGLCNSLIRTILKQKTLRTYREKWSPEWVVISDSMLKFHDHDRREIIRDEIMKKYFDK
jgi:hypothetical protein